MNFSLLSLLEEMTEVVKFQEFLFQNFCNNADYDKYFPNANGKNILQF